jgi:hypothetical protein
MVTNEWHKSDDLYLVYKDHLPPTTEYPKELGKRPYYDDIPQIEQQIGKELKTIHRWKEWAKKLYMMF